MFAILRWTITATILLAPCMSQAYVGPGAGLSAIGSVLALIGATLLLIVGFVWFPIKRLLKRRKGNPPQPESGTGSSSSDSQPK